MSKDKNTSSDSSSSRATRREFLQGISGAALALGVVGVAGTTALGKEDNQMATNGPKKGVLYDMLPSNLSMEDRFKLAKDVGFDGVEAPPISDPNDAEKMRTAAEAAGIPIHSVIYGGWDPTLSDPDPAKVEQSLKNAEAALHGAKIMGAETMLLVPGVVNAQTRYVDCYNRTQKNVHKLIPLAEKVGVVICIEEVWNNFLMSPLEYCRYIDEFKSPWVQAYFDVGNVVRFAWPQDWILTVAKRIKKVHLKDFKGGPGLWGDGHFCPLLEGSIDWHAVREAFRTIDYNSFMTTELQGGDEAYLRDVSSRVDKILAS